MTEVRAGVPAAGAPRAAPSSLSARPHLSPFSRQNSKKLNPKVKKKNFDSSAVFSREPPPGEPRGRGPRRVPAPPVLLWPGPLSARSPPPVPWQPPPCPPPAAGQGAGPGPGRGCFSSLIASAPSLPLGAPQGWGAEAHGGCLVPAAHTARGEAARHRGDGERPGTGRAGRERK